MISLEFLSLRKLALFFLLACSLAFAKPLNAALVDTLRVSVAGETLPAGVWRAKSANAPVYVWFHGGMTSGRCDKGLEAGEGFFEIAQSAGNDFVVVSPSACKDRHWVSASIYSVDAVLDSLEKKLSRKIAAVSLVGVSDGCLGVMAYSLVGKRNVEKRLLVSGYLANVWRAEDLAREPRLQGSWDFLQGASDRLYPSELTYPWIEAFCQNQGVNCTKHFDAAGEHDWSYWTEKRKDWILEFIRNKN